MGIYVVFITIYISVLVSVCIRVCRNGGTLNGINCTCDCADGFSGSSCTSEYICCEEVSSIKCSTQLHVIVILKCAFSSVYMAYAPWHETPREGDNNRPEQTWEYCRSYVVCTVLDCILEHISMLHNSPWSRL